MHRVNLAISAAFSVFLAAYWLYDSARFPLDVASWVLHPIKGLKGLPWVLATFTDNIFQSFFISMWAFHRESGVFKYMWPAAIICGGGLGGSLYVFKTLFNFCWETNFKGNGMHPPVWTSILRGKGSNPVGNFNHTKLELFISALGATMTGLCIASWWAVGHPFTQNVTRQPYIGLMFSSLMINTFWLACWISYKERSMVSRIGWIAAIFLLGSIGTSLYLFSEISKLNEREHIWHVLFPDRIPLIKGESKDQYSQNRYELRTEHHSPNFYSPSITRARDVSTTD